MHLIYACTLPYPSLKHVEAGREVGGAGNSSRTRTATFELVQPCELPSLPRALDLSQTPGAASPVVLGGSRQSVPRLTGEGRVDSSRPVDGMYIVILYCKVH